MEEEVDGMKGVEQEARKSQEDHELELFNFSPEMNHSSSPQTDRVSSLYSDYASDSTQ